MTTRRPAVVAPAAGPAGRKLSRDNAMAMKIRLAEKDQQLLQTQEFIQVRVHEEREVGGEEEERKVGGERGGRWEEREEEGGRGQWLPCVLY